jgi:hypothetical protein
VRSDRWTAVARPTPGVIATVIVTVIATVIATVTVGAPAVAVGADRAS